MNICRIPFKKMYGITLILMQLVKLPRMGISMSYDSINIKVIFDISVEPVYNQLTSYLLI